MELRVSKLGELCTVIFCLQGHVTGTPFANQNINGMLMSIMGCITSHLVM